MQQHLRRLRLASVYGDGKPRRDQRDGEKRYGCQTHQSLLYADF
jgi:hypothetical protein